MRTPILVALTLLLTVAYVVPADVNATDTASISRDARGPQPAGMNGPLGSPPTPAFYLLSQTTIFAAGIILLGVAAALGGYTLLLVRRQRASR